MVEITSEISGDVENVKTLRHTDSDHNTSIKPSARLIMLDQFIISDQGHQSAVFHIMLSQIFGKHYSNHHRPMFTLIWQFYFSDNAEFLVIQN